MPPDAAHTRILRKNGRPDAIEFTRCSLVVTSGPDKGKRAPLERSTLRIGGSAECTLVLSDQAVSRIHCEIEIDERGFLLRDLGSTNGVFVGGLLAREIYLEPGSSFSVGATRIELEPSNERSQIRLSEKECFGKVLGRSVKMREIFFVLEKMASKDVTILLTGETGTGKEVFARSIHETSARRNGPFVTVDCGSLPETLIESELFGHAKGAFTGATTERAGAFEDSDGGTVFLDEVGELPLLQQTKLLRILETRQIKRLGENSPRSVDVRVLAATHRSLADDVESEKFRKDLFFRLSVLEIRIPALRERPDDIPMIAESFLSSFAARGQSLKLSSGALSALSGHPWPGNVRELRNVIEKAIALRESDEIDAAAIALSSVQSRPDPGREGSGSVRIDGRDSYVVSLDRFEREYLLDLLRKNEMNVSHAARVAGLHRQTIYRMLRKHGINASDLRS